MSVSAPYRLDPVLRHLIDVHGRLFQAMGQFSDILRETTLIERQILQQTEFSQQISRERERIETSLVTEVTAAQFPPISIGVDVPPGPGVTFTPPPISVAVTYPVILINPISELRPARINHYNLETSATVSEVLDLAFAGVPIWLLIDNISGSAIKFSFDGGRNFKTIPANGTLSLALWNIPAGQRVIKHKSDAAASVSFEVLAGEID